jgi:hypothetical protein
MKINITNSAIALAISLLMGYGFYEVDSNPNKILVAGGSFFVSIVTFIPMIGLNFHLTRTGLNAKIVSGVFFLLFLISSLIFSFIKFSAASYIITNGIVLMLFILIFRAIYISKQ